MSERPDADLNADDITRADQAAPRADSIGPYKLLQRVGEGGMGEVWLAEQTRPIHRQAALKIIKAGMDTAQVVARFEAERQALALMSHPAIAQVFDGGATPQGRPFFAMEYVRGEPITTYCNRHSLTTRQRIDLFLDVCEGVQHAHQKGIIHRDLKPSNILVAVRDDRAVPKIIDFGVAKATTQSLTERTLLTEFGAMIGTPEYMSPEQAEMTGLDVDTRTDVYALGLVLYELLTGAPVVDARSLREKPLDEIRRTIREVDPPRPSTRVTKPSDDAAAGRRSDAGAIARELRGDLDWITMRALEKDRTRRYGSASEFAADLRRHLENVPVLASPPSGGYRVGKFVRRHRIGVAAAATAFIVLVVFAATMGVQARRVARERDRANREAEASQQVSQFLAGLFKVADPWETQSATLTAREILDKGARDIETTLAAQPEVQARLQAVMGAVYTNLGLYEVAASLLQRALATQQRRSRDGPDAVMTMHALANAYWSLGRYRDAELLYLPVIDARRRTLGAEHADTLRAQYDLASTYSRQGRWDEADRLDRLVLDHQRRVLGEEHYDTIQTLGNLASVYWKMGRYAEALPVATRALELQIRVSGADHPETFERRHNVATTYDRLERYDEAESEYRKAIEGKRKVLGPGHPSTAVTVLRFAQMLQRQRRYSEAESELLLTDRALRALPRADQQSTKSVVEQLVQLYEASNASDKAAEWRAKLPKDPAAK